MHLFSSFLFFLFLLPSFLSFTDISGMGFEVSREQTFHAKYFLIDTVIVSSYAVKTTSCVGEALWEVKAQDATRSPLSREPASAW